MASTVASKQEGPGFEPPSCRGLACSPRVCVGYVWVPPTDLVRLGQLLYINGP